MQQRERLVLRKPCVHGGGRREAGWPMGGTEEHVGSTPCREQSDHGKENRKAPDQPACRCALRHL
jgi:hypothetical protein